LEQVFRSGFAAPAIQRVVANKTLLGRKAAEGRRTPRRWCDIPVTHDPREAFWTAPALWRFAMKSRTPRLEFSGTAFAFDFSGNFCVSAFHLLWSHSIFFRFSLFVNFDFRFHFPMQNWLKIESSRPSVAI
jgi:hypothetical protein